MSRHCSRTCCRAPATIRLEYDYAAATVWLLDILPTDDRAPVELCADHGDGLGIPRGWLLHDRRTAAQPFFVPQERLAG